MRHPAPRSAQHTARHTAQHTARHTARTFHSVLDAVRDIERVLVARVLVVLGVLGEDLVNHILRVLLHLRRVKPADKCAVCVLGVWCRCQSVRHVLCNKGWLYTHDARSSTIWPHAYRHRVPTHSIHHPHLTRTTPFPSKLSLSARPQAPAAPRELNARHAALPRDESTPPWGAPTPPPAAANAHAYIRIDACQTSVASPTHTDRSPPSRPRPRDVR